MPTQTNPLFLLYAVIVAQFGHLLFVLLRRPDGKPLWRYCLTVFAVLLATHGVLLAADLPGYAITYSILVAGFGGLALWLHYELSRSNPILKEEILVAKTSFTPAAAPKYEKSGLDQLALATGGNQLTLVMETERPYLDSGLRLRDLAERSDLPEHHLSQILNAHFGKKFQDCYPL